MEDEAIGVGGMGFGVLFYGVELEISFEQLNVVKKERNEML